MSTIVKVKVRLIYEDSTLSVHKSVFQGDLSDYALTLSKGEPFVFLDSAGGMPKLNKWSYLAINPGAIISFKDGKLKQNGCLLKNKDPFLLLRDFYNDGQPKNANKISFTPYIGGPIGYISYDAARYIEKLPVTTEDDLKLPDFYFMKPKQVLAHNLQTRALFIYTYSDHDSSIKEILGCLDKDPADKSSNFKVFGPLTANMSKDDFKEAIYKIRDYIYKGDVYQVNFSQRFEKSFSGESYALYEKLRSLNPGPFCGYLKGEGFSLLCSSPERLAYLNVDHAETRPIAGTRRRGQNKKEDDFLKGHLLLDNKERAEHIMLVDLERNDLGKVCDYKSVHVSDLMGIEEYSHVIHIVSNVCGRLHPKCDAIDLVKALFPGGTITGCPKVRCMEIIEELEPTRRGAYTGSLGYFSFNGNIDINILIRTIAETKDKVYLQAGAGIVADSVAEREYFETISKAQALFKSLGEEFTEKQWEKMSI